MKIRIQLFVFFLLCLFSFSSFAQKKVKPVRDTLVVQDSIVYYEVEIGVNQKNYLDLLTGDWVIDTVRRQARAVPEVLSNFFISFHTDSTFTGTLGCIKINGTYRLKGTSIKFISIYSSNDSCEQRDQFVSLQNLLIHTVSAYTVDNELLLLRDGSSNVVFRGHRKKD